MNNWSVMNCIPLEQHYVNYQLPDVQAGFRKGRGTGDQIANICSVQFSSVQFLSCVQLFVTTWTAVRQSSLSHELLEFTQVYVH